MGMTLPVAETWVLVLGLTAYCSLSLSLAALPAASLTPLVVSPFGAVDDRRSMLKVLMVAADTRLAKADPAPARHDRDCDEDCIVLLHRPCEDGVYLCGDSTIDVR